MNRTKRNLIIAAAVINLIDIISSLAMVIYYRIDPSWLQNYAEYVGIIVNVTNSSFNLVYQIIMFITGLIGSIFLLYCVRADGKYYRGSRGIYVAGVIIVILTGGLVPWILLLIAAFKPDIIINNDRAELRREFEANLREEVLHNAAYEEKKHKIEELKKLRDAGTITEEEYKEKLFELL